MLLVRCVQIRRAMPEVRRMCDIGEMSWAVTRWQRWLRCLQGGNEVAEASSWYLSGTLGHYVVAEMYLR
jgi:hypothetical protein